MSLLFGNDVWLTFDSYRDIVDGRDLELLRSCLSALSTLVLITFELLYYYALLDGLSRRGCFSTLVLS